MNELSGVAASRGVAVVAMKEAYLPDTRGKGAGPGSPGQRWPKGGS